MTLPCFTHVSIVARDWRRLACFYETALGCERVPPERDLAGDWLAAGTGVPGAGRLTFVYLADPEGNVIELQRWERPADP